MKTATAASRGVQTPLLGRLFDAIKEDQRLVVIDFGIGSAALLDALQPYRARLDAMAIAEKLEDWSSLEAQEDRADALADHFIRFNLEPADWVLCWGLLNYLDAPLITQLSKQLVPHLKPHGRIHALIEYSSPTMPAIPAQHQLFFEADQVHLDIDSVQSSIASPRYTPKRLEGLLTGLKTENTILLSNGMQEYIFSRA